LEPSGRRYFTPLLGRHETLLFWPDRIRCALAGIAGLLKLIFGSNELINTMMLNYIAILFVEFVIHGPIKPPDSYLYVSAEVLPSAKLPIILSKTPLHLGFIISLFVVAGVFYLMYRTPIGYQMRTVGANLRAASYAGINIVAVTIVALITTGGLAGMGGALELLGAQLALQRFLQDLNDGIGVADGRYTRSGSSWRLLICRHPSERAPLQRGAVFIPCKVLQASLCFCLAGPYPKNEKTVVEKALMEIPLIARC